MTEKLFAVAIIVFVTAIKLLGTNALVTFSSLLLVLSFLPVVIYVGWGFTVQNPSRWVSWCPDCTPSVASPLTLRCGFSFLVQIATEFYDEDTEVDWPLFISWVLWLFSGFFRYHTLTQPVI